MFMFGPFGAIQSTLYASIALQEIVLALWLIAKGFDTSAIASGSDQRMPTRDGRGDTMRAVSLAEASKRKDDSK